MELTILPKTLGWEGKNPLKIYRATVPFGEGAHPFHPIFLFLPAPMIVRSVTQGAYKYSS